MKAWWLARSQREQIIIAVGAGLIGLLAALQLIIAPVFNWRADAAQRTQTAERDYRLVYRSAATASSGDPSAADTATPVRNLLNDVASEFEVQLTFVNAQPDGAVDMQAGPAAPDKIFQMLFALESRHGVKVASADIARSSDDASKVRVQARLAR